MQIEGTGAEERENIGKRANVAHGRFLWMCLPRLRFGPDGRNSPESGQLNLQKSGSCSAWNPFLTVEMDSALSKTSGALKLLMFNNYKQVSGQIFAGFSENRSQILGQNAGSLDYAQRMLE